MAKTDSLFKTLFVVDESVVPDGVELVPLHKDLSRHLVRYVFPGDEMQIHVNGGRIEAREPFRVVRTDRA